MISAALDVADLMPDQWIARISRQRNAQIPALELQTGTGLTSGFALAAWLWSPVWGHHARVGTPFGAGSGPFTRGHRIFAGT